MIDINKLIAEAMKSKQKERLETLKLIKTELVKVEKSGVTLNEEKELKTLLKMISQREEAIAQYKKGNREDLAEKEQAEIDIINEFIPKQPTEEEIKNYASECIEKYIAQNDSDYKISMKDMKPIMTMVQEKYPTANGKIVSNTLKENING